MSLLDTLLAVLNARICGTSAARFPRGFIGTGCHLLRGQGHLLSYDDVDLGSSQPVLICHRLAALLPRLLRDVSSPLTYESERVPDEVHLYAASLSDLRLVTPSRHVFVAEQLPWLEILDDLPRFEATSRGGATPLGRAQASL